MTVPVSVQQRIRVLDAHGMSWRSIAKEVGVAATRSRSTPGGRIALPDPERSVSPPSKLDPFRATVDGWLQADRFMPRKQRHTAKRVYDRLVSEKGYEGSYSPVQRYVKRWREEHRLPSDGYLELKWHPGEAQVDFGMAQAVVGRGPGRRALPGRHVPVFEHALLRGPARGERRMRVRGAAHGVRAHRRGPPDAGA